MKKYLIALITFFTVLNIAISQDTINKFDKSTEGAIIISESDTINIAGTNIADIKYSFQKSMKVRILNDEGAKLFSKITIPQSFDPTYIGHAPKDRNYEKIFSGYEVNYFKAKIISEDGSEREVEFKRGVEEVLMVDGGTDYYGRYYKYHFSNNQIKPGDVLEINYEYNVPYGENFGELSALRIFFNGNVYKENYHLTISHHNNLPIEIDEVNGAVADSTIKLEKKNIYKWNAKSLFPIAKEKGGRVYLTAPHIVFSIKPYSLLYMVPQSFEERFIPFYAIFVMKREERILHILLESMQDVNTKQIYQIEDFIEKYTKDTQDDTTGYKSLASLHTKIVDDFEFANDIRYFKKYDTRDPRIGDHLSKHEIRDISRYSTYFTLVSKLDLGYYTCYLSDIRCGELSNDYYSPFYKEDFALAAFLKDNTLQYILPKKSRFGYYLNEFPFYYEGANSVFVHISDYKMEKEFINDSLRRVRLPRSNVRENVRKTNVKVDIKLEDLSASFQAKVNLSGQFSTLSRGVYLYDDKDETVNDLYHKKVWDIHEGILVKSQELKMVKKVFPFPAVLNAQYESHKIVKAQNDTIRLSIKNWFNHIIYKGFQIENRQLDFYPDFYGHDVYNYFVEFDKDIKLASNFEDVDIKNEFGNLKISIKQMSPRTVKISSLFTNTKEKVAPEHIKDVQDVFNRIEKLNASEIVFIISEK